MGHGSFFKTLIYAFAIIFTAFLNASPSFEASSKNEIDQFLMPEDHPIKPLLDALFSSTRAIFHTYSLENAGFIKCKPRKFTKLIVTKHPAIPGYVFKLYLDVQRFHKDLPESHFWSLRCRGVKKIRKVIAALSLEQYFKTPKKWIYELPINPKPPITHYTKHYILIEEDMDILADDENKDYWASERVSKELLQGLYQILIQIGLRDCVKPDNIPFCRDGKVAFIDTQTFNEKVNLNEFAKFLSKENQKYWKELKEKN